MKRLALFACLALAACTDPHQPLSPDFGNAVHANIAAQVVKADPLPPGATDTDGQRIDNALDRYRTNKVYRPRIPTAVSKDNAE